MRLFHSFDIFLFTKNLNLAKSLPNAHNYVQPNMVLNSTTLKAKKLNEKKIDSYSPSVKYLQKVIYFIFYFIFFLFSYKKYY